MRSCMKAFYVVQSSSSTIALNELAEEFQGAPLTDVGTDLDIETGMLPKNHGDDGALIILDTLISETVREQEGRASTKRQRLVSDQEVKPENESSAGPQAQPNVVPKVPLAGAESNSGRSSVVVAWNVELPAARIRQQEDYHDTVSRMRGFRLERHR
ncbi:uncharacterized protein K441DRAFT_679339 [Cenococcum geophilum 1.58]|uniref:uncharacterized protein n=1 Tax=Cenococcum geophilum 1.58 TaxID=794803 RepID=UPI0035902E35|nr:hypothetical protein K441DRAFT_679339 [Cenococcum geophilum 1.58]